MKRVVALGFLMLAAAPLARAQDTSAWSDEQNSGGLLSVTTASALAGTTYGLQVAMNDLQTRWVENDFDTNETRYRSRFYFDTNNFDTGNASNINRTVIFIAVDRNPAPEALATRRLFLESIRYRPDETPTFGTPYAVIFWVFQPSIGNYVNFGPFRVSPGEHFVETDWKAATSSGGTDGTFEVWIDGASPSGSVLTGLRTFGYGADFCRLGIIQPLASSNTTIYYDEFESRRATLIGTKL